MQTPKIEYFLLQNHVIRLKYNTNMPPPYTVLWGSQFISIQM